MTARSDSARQRIAAQIVGRERELDLLLAAVATGRDVVLEGPPGTSKTTILKAITREWGVPLVLAEGNAELTPAKLLGYHDPARVMSEGYGSATFVDGPLVQAMRSGSFLYLEEFNRAPEDTLNALLTAIADRSLSIPRVGVVDARPTFRVLASMNPYDNVGTTRLSTSIRDRLCQIEVGYQDAASELEIVILRTGLDALDGLTNRVARDAVALTRATRVHADIRQGSSVRGAIDLSLIACELLRQRGLGPSASGYAETILDAMLVALSGRVLLDEASGASAASVLREIWENHFVLDDALAEPG
jgi:MoxR-like ATPase